jgi:hypothetical protein
MRAVIIFEADGVAAGLAFARGCAADFFVVFFVGRRFGIGI